MKVAEVQQHGNTKISKMSRWLSPTGSLAETLLSNVENEVAAAVKAAAKIQEEAKMEAVVHREIPVEPWNLP